MYLKYKFKSFYLSAKKCSIDKAIFELDLLVKEPSPVVKDSYFYYLDSPCIDLSIIIPMYNCESYISLCLESAINQKTKFTFEVLCINDGSTDATSDKLQEYCANKDKVRVFSVENGGAAKARNTGIRHAKGRYIMFLDADDILLPGAIDTLMKKSVADDMDIVAGAYLPFHDKMPEILFDTDTSRVFTEFSDQNFDSYIRDGFPWGKVYKRELWSNCRFPEGYHFEDTIIRALLFRLAKKSAVTEIPVVGYRLHSASITSRLDKNNKQAILMIWTMREIDREIKRLQLESSTNIVKFMASHLTRNTLMRARNADVDVLNYVFVVARALGNQYSSDDEQFNSYFVTHAFDAMKKNDIKKWYLYSMLAYYE